MSSLNLKEREDLFKDCVAQLVAAHGAIHDKDEKINPDHPFYVAANGLCKVFRDGDVPANCRKIFDSGFVGFVPAWESYTKRMREHPQNPSWKPDAVVWRGYLDLKSKMKEQILLPQRKRESVAELLDSGVSPRQIALIYDRFTSHGAPDEDWVARAKADPERYNGDDTRYPYQKRAETNDDWLRNFAMALRDSRQVRAVRAALERGEDPDAPNERVHRGVPMAEELPGLAFGGDQLYMPEPLRMVPQEPHEEIEAYQEEPFYDDRITVEQRAVMLLNEGIPDAEIVQQLGISGQKLGAIKRRRGEIAMPV